MMKTSYWWNRGIKILDRAKEEVIKVSQMGKTHLNRSFLLHERNKLHRKLGEKTHHLVKMKKINLVDLDRLIDQIDRVGKKIIEIEDQMKELTKDFSLKLDAEEQTDIVKRKIGKKRR